MDLAVLITAKPLKSTNPAVFCGGKTVWQAKKDVENHGKPILIYKVGGVSTSMSVYRISHVHILRQRAWLEDPDQLNEGLQLGTSSITIGFPARAMMAPEGIPHQISHY